MALSGRALFLVGGKFPANDASAVKDAIERLVSMTPIPPCQTAARGLPHVMDEMSGKETFQLSYPEVSQRVSTRLREW